MTEKGCDNCYYAYFDERAYPCSLCIRGIERTDMWQPSKKTKADLKTEPSSSEIPNNCEPQTGEMMTEEEFDSMLARVLIGKDEPQTDCSWK